MKHIFFDITIKKLYMKMKICDVYVCKIKKYIIYNKVLINKI